MTQSSSCNAFGMKKISQNITHTREQLTDSLGFIFSSVANVGCRRYENNYICGGDDTFTERLL